MVRIFEQVIDFYCATQDQFRAYDLEDCVQIPLIDEVDLALVEPLKARCNLLDGILELHLAPGKLDQVGWNTNFDISAFSLLDDKLFLIIVEVEHVGEVW